MGKCRKSVSIIGAFFAFSILTVCAAAEEEGPRLLDTPAFAVDITDQSGGSVESFDRGTPPYVNMTFALALSASDNYATTITLIQDGGGKFRKKRSMRALLKRGSTISSLPPA